MGRFTGWLALIVILGGLGYVMYQDLKLRREHAAGSTIVSNEAPPPTIEGSAAVDPEPSQPAPTTVVPDEPTVAAEPAAAEDVPAEEPAVATADASAPTAADDQASAPIAVDAGSSPQADADATAPPPVADAAEPDTAEAPPAAAESAKPETDLVPAPDVAAEPARDTDTLPPEVVTESAAEAEPPVEAGPSTVAEESPPPAADVPPVVMEAEAAPPAEEGPSVAAEETSPLAADAPAVITEAEVVPPAVAEVEPPATAAVAPEPATDESVTDAPATTAETVTAAPVADEAPEGAGDSAPPTETRAASLDEEPVPADAAAIPSAAEESGSVETEIAVAPEGVPGAATGDRAPVSESSGRDHSLQAAPAPEGEPETVIAAVDPAADIDIQSPATEPTPLQPGIESDVAGTVPTFDVVRVESTGDAVIAGLAAPGAEIAIVSGANTIATATASATGDWAIALEEPLPPGQYDLAIRATTEEGDTTVSDQRVAVLVPEAPVEEPLVILNTPDAPSTVFQVPSGPGIPDTTMADADVSHEPETPTTVIAELDSGEVDAAPSLPPPAAVLDGEAEVVPDTGGSDPAAPAVIAEAEPPAPTMDGGGSPASPESDAAASPVATEEETSVAAAEPAAAMDDPPEADPVASDAGTAPDGAGVIAAVEPPPGGAEASAEPEDPPATAPEPEMAVVSEPEPAPEPEPIVPVVVVTAVEAETTGALFVAGTAITPEVVRVYLDDLLLGEATPSPSGTWLIEVQRDLPAGTYDVRADQVEGGSGTVIARAEVPFEREVDVAILTPVAEAGGPSGAEATGSLAGPTTVIIKRRDNLWRISRQLYGKGIRWSTIYQANKDQIRNPRWIYPGQVFILPEGNVAWEGDGKVAAE